MSSWEKFRRIIAEMTGSASSLPLSGYSVSSQFDPEENDDDSRARNINAAFLMLLSGGEGSEEAGDYLREHAGHGTWSGPAGLFLEGVEYIKSEIEARYDSDHEFRRDLDELYEATVRTSSQVSIDTVRRFFFPEGDIDTDNPLDAINDLREKRSVTITRLNENPVSDPARQVLLTSNVLLTIPHPRKNLEDMELPFPVREALKEVCREEQLYWYDHPIQMGTAPEHNEIIYGLSRLDEALTFEKKIGTMAWDAYLTCILSVSVTHEGLHGIAREYLASALAAGCRLRNIKVYAFTERDCRRLLDEVILPAAGICGIRAGADIMSDIFGVDGEYGRHYSFLKAVSALWQVFVDEQVRGTFKIDLDQVFPQHELVEQTGSSALGHLRTGLWGAEGLDNRGNVVHLGMIAGALVNDRDIDTSLYTPDVVFNRKKPAGDAIVFNSIQPQALSTAAEMMTRYGGESPLDGTRNALQRVHVTGGTNGILTESLRKYRPFTPTFIGRAEDQAYIFSVLFRYRDTGFLRYVHCDGLIMRHDKESFAGEAIEAARYGKIIGDCARILLFSMYAGALPWPKSTIKEAVDPFTGCFISRMPVTVALLRFAFRTVEFFHDGERDAPSFLVMGADRLGPLIRDAARGGVIVREKVRREEEGWNLFYDILDGMEKLVRDGVGEADSIRHKAREIIGECMIHI